MCKQTGGPSWVVPLGRRDSRGASLSGSNNNIPAPNNTFQTILTKFKLQGLDIVDLVALSGKISKHLNLGLDFNVKSPSPCFISHYSGKFKD